MSLSFIQQFEGSQNTLKDLLGESGVLLEAEYSEDIDQNTPSGDKNYLKCDTVAPVELIVGENKYSLSDLLVVEKAEEEYCDFKGFLNNLGNSCTFFSSAYLFKKIFNYCLSKYRL